MFMFIGITPNMGFMFMDMMFLLAPLNTMLGLNGDKEDCVRIKFRLGVIGKGLGVIGWGLGVVETGHMLELWWE